MHHWKDKKVGKREMVYGLLLVDRSVVVSMLVGLNRSHQTKLSQKSSCTHF